MTLEEFAKDAGCVVQINPSPEGWRGKWEFYPYRGDSGRCAKDDIPELLRMIADTQEGDDE